MGGLVDDVNLPPVPSARALHGALPLLRHNLKFPGMGLLSRAGCDILQLHEGR